MPVVLWTDVLVWLWSRSRLRILVCAPARASAAPWARVLRSPRRSLRGGAGRVLSSCRARRLAALPAALEGKDPKAAAGLRGRSAVAARLRCRMACWTRPSELTPRRSPRARTPGNRSRPGRQSRARISSIAPGGAHLEDEADRARDIALNAMLGVVSRRSLVRSSLQLASCLPHAGGGERLQVWSACSTEILTCRGAPPASPG